MKKKSSLNNLENDATKFKRNRKLELRANWKRRAKRKGEKFFSFFLQVMKIKVALFQISKQTLNKSNNKQQTTPKTSSPLLATTIKTKTTTTTNIAVIILLAHVITTGKLFAVPISK